MANRLLCSLALATLLHPGTILGSRVGDDAPDDDQNKVPGKVHEEKAHEAGEVSGAKRDVRENFNAAAREQPTDSAREDEAVVVHDQIMKRAPIDSLMLTRSEHQDHQHDLEDDDDDVIKAVLEAAPELGEELAKKINNLEIQGKGKAVGTLLKVMGGYMDKVARGEDLDKKDHVNVFLQVTGVFVTVVAGSCCPVTVIASQMVISMVKAIFELDADDADTQLHDQIIGEVKDLLKHEMIGTQLKNAQLTIKSKVDSFARNMQIMDLGSKEVPSHTMDLIKLLGYARYEQELSELMHLIWGADCVLIAQGDTTADKTKCKNFQRAGTIMIGLPAAILHLSVLQDMIIIDPGVKKTHLRYLADIAALYYSLAQAAFDELKQHRQDQVEFPRIKESWCFSPGIFECKFSWYQDKQLSRSIIGPGVKDYSDLPESVKQVCKSVPANALEDAKFQRGCEFWPCKKIIERGQESWKDKDYWHTGDECWSKYVAFFKQQLTDAFSPDLTDLEHLKSSARKAAEKFEERQLRKLAAARAALPANLSPRTADSPANPFASTSQQPPAAASSHSRQTQPQ